MVDQALDTNYELAWRTLDVYPGRPPNRPGIALLRAFILGHQAELYQRTSRSVQARRRWHAMLADNPFQPAVLGNIAVAHSSAGDVGPAAYAWERYLESLYLGDLLSPDPRHGAVRRAGLHRTLAASFGTARIVPPSAETGPLDANAAQVPPVLARGNAVALAMAHLRLEELNLAISRQNPALVLAVDRVAGTTRLDQGRDRRLAFAAQACAELPRRIRAPFTLWCQDQITSAYQTASAPGGLVRKPAYAAEEEAYASWVRGRILWKAGLRGAITAQDAEWPLTDYSGDVIVNLRLIDELSLDPGDEHQRRSVQQLGFPGDPGECLDQLSQLSDLAVRFALTRIFAEARASGARAFPSRFARAGRSWVRTAIPGDYIERLDDPGEVYIPSAQAALRVLRDAGDTLTDPERREIETALPALRHWIARLPGATGPARTLASLLSALGRHEEAHTVLSDARAAAFSPAGERATGISLVRVAVDRGEYREAVASIRCLAADGDDDPRLRALFVHAYNRWIGAGADGLTVQQISEDLARWDDDDAVSERRLLQVNATIVTHQSRADQSRADQSRADQSRADQAGPEALIRDLRWLCADDQGNDEARHCLVRVLYQFAQGIRQQMRGSAGPARAQLRALLDEQLSECRENAEFLLNCGGPAGKGVPDGERRAEITQIWEALTESSPAS
jgi:hypothetical protein